MNMRQIGSPVGIPVLLVGAVCAAVDKATGEELAEIELPGPTNTAPMTYMHEGRQYIIVSVGGRGHIGEHVALALPQE